MTSSQHDQSELEAILAERYNQYTYGLVQSALNLDKENCWRNCITVVQLRSGQAPEPKMLTYPEFRLYQVPESPDQILELVRHLAGSQLHVADEVISLVGGRFARLGTRDRLGLWSRSGQGWIFNEWPGDQYLFEATRTASPPSTPLTASGFPMYPDAYSAIKHIIGVDLRQGLRWDAGVYFYLPDYRARIEKVTQGIESISVHIKTKTAYPEQLLGKVYASSQDGLVLQQDILFNHQEETVDIGFQSEHIYVGLLTKDTGELLDVWEFDPLRFPLEDSTLVAGRLTPQFIEQLINRGETNTVEFKPGKKEDNDKKEIAESAIAFANKSGGIILVGVNDKAGVEGAFGGGWEDLILQSLHERCDPPIEPSVSKVTIDGKPVYAVIIKEGNDKPYFMRGTWVAYMRVGSTDRPATRYEHIEMFRSSSSSSNPLDPFYT